MTTGYGMGYGGFCPTCGCQANPSMSFGHFPGPMGGFVPGYGWGYPDWSNAGWGLGGLRTWGGTYSPQFLSTGLPTDQEIAEMIYDALDDDPIVPYDAPINVDVDTGVVTLTGTVPNKRAKHAAGDDAWWIPGVDDVINSIEVTGRRRTRTAPKEGRSPSTGKGR